MTDGKEALRRQLDEKLRVLIRRERDVHTLLRRVSQSNRWYEAAAHLAARIASLDTPIAALTALAEAFAETLGYEYVTAMWGGLRVDRPSTLPSSVAAAFAQIEPRRAGGAGVVDLPAQPGVFELQRLDIASAQQPGDAIVVATARTERTAGYSRAVDRDAREQLQHLTEMLGSAFDAVRLRRRVVEERDSLQVAVAVSTTELREAVAAAELARVEAERAASSRSEFLANMSHEIRTPMTAVLGYAELLLDDDPVHRRRYVETIVKSGRHLLQILDDVLDLARIESGRLEIDRQELALPSLLLDIHSLLSVSAAERRVHLELRFATPLPSRVVIDGNRVRQILINLVGNAIKFTDHGSVIVEVTARDEQLRAEVIDTGVGIPAHMHELVFDAFAQVNTGATRRHGGTGLGLPISRRLARMMGGDVTMTSELGHGSRFVLQVPYGAVADAPLVERPDAWTTHEVEANPTAYALSGRVLVVDDTGANRAMFTSLLTRIGLTVEVAADGMSAIDAVGRAAEAGTPFQVVLMDMQMPIMDGYEATRRLRLAHPDLAVIALTAHAMAGDRDACLAAGCADYLAKPVRRQDLYATVGRFVRHATAPPRYVRSEFADDEVVGPLLAEFTNDMLATAAELDEAARRGERQAVRQLAHRLRGTAATFGFPALAQAAADAERMAADERSAFQDLRAAVGNVQAQAALIEPIPKPS